MRQLEVHIPMLPPKEASPNWKPKGEGTNWVRIKALKPWRELVYYSAISARNDWESLRWLPHAIRWQPLTAATISVTFYVPNRRYVQDDANALGSLKEAIDELTMPSARKRGAAILLDDSPDVLTFLKPRWEFGVAPFHPAWGASFRRGESLKGKATIIRLKEVQ